MFVQICDSGLVESGVKGRLVCCACVCLCVCVCVCLMLVLGNFRLVQIGK